MANVSNMSLSVVDEIFDEEQDESDVLKRALLGILIATVYFIVATSNLGLVFYESVVSDNYRTLINKMAAVASAYNVLFITVMLFPIFINMVLNFHDLGRFFCTMHQFSFLLTMMMVFLGHNEVVLLRYVYTCRLSTVGSIREGFFKGFFVVMNFVIGIFFSLSLVVLNGSRLSVYRSCRGLPNQDEDASHPAQQLPSLFALLTLLVHICSFWRIRLKKDSILQQEFQDREKGALTLGPAISTCLMAAAAVSTLISIMMTLVGRTLPLIPLLRVPTLATFVVVVPVSVYAKKPHVRKTLMKELKNLR